MVKVIETNISLDKNDDIVDFQSRVIEVDSWESLVSEITNAESITRKASLGNMFGVTLPRNARVENIKVDDDNLSCDVYNFCNMKDKKLVQLIRED